MEITKQYYIDNMNMTDAEAEIAYSQYLENDSEYTIYGEGSFAKANELALGNDIQVSDKDLIDTFLDDLYVKADSELVIHDRY